MENEEKSSKLLVILRWCAVLPVSVLSSIIANILIQLICNFNKSYVGVEPGVFSLTDIFIFFVVNIFVGAAWVYFGTLMAPNYRKVVSIVLTILLAMLIAVSLFISCNTSGFSWDSVSMIVSLVSAIVICVKINDESIGFSGD